MWPEHIEEVFQCTGALGHAQNEVFLEATNDEKPQIKEKLKTPPAEVIQAIKAYKTQPKDFNEALYRLKKQLIGITCFSERGSNKRMWEESNYGDNHQGFCLCFETEFDKSFFSGIEKVKYSFDKKNKPEIVFNSTKFNDQIQKYIFSKSKDLFWEEEYRLLKMKIGLHFFQKNSLTEIILGKEMTPDNKDKIKQIVKTSNYKNVFITEN